MLNATVGNRGVKSIMDQQGNWATRNWNELGWDTTLVPSSGPVYSDLTHRLATNE